MPGSWARVAPFLSRLPTLAAGQKAAAVNLGIFPDSSGTAYAYAAPVQQAPSARDIASTVSSGRLSGIDALLGGNPAPPLAAPSPIAQQPAYTTSQPVQIAYAAPPKPASVQRTATVTQSKIWLQLASGRNSDALSGQFRRMKARNPSLFEGIEGYVVESPDHARLLIGPFHGPSDADFLAQDLQTVGVDAFRWSNSANDRIVPLASE